MAQATGWQERPELRQLGLNQPSLEPGGAEPSKPLAMVAVSTRSSNAVCVCVCVSKDMDGQERMGGGSSLKDIYDVLV